MILRSRLVSSGAAAGAAAPGCRRAESSIDVDLRDPQFPRDVFVTVSRLRAFAFATVRRCDPLFPSVYRLNSRDHADESVGRHREDHPPTAFAPNASLRDDS